MSAMSPAGAAMLVRSVSFRLEPAEADRWAGGRRFTSHLMNALSAFLPSGEAYFIETMRAWQAKTPAPAELGVEGFVRQESTHRHQHMLYNEAVADRYPWFRDFIRYADGMIATVQRRSSLATSLAVTVAIEHFTSSLARLMLDDRELLGESEFAALWRWHALEELEHKSVAFDLYASAVGDRRRLRWAMRGFVLLFLLEFSVVFARLLASDRQLLRLETWRSLQAALTSPIARTLRAEYRHFMRADFDPCEQDDAERLRRWRSDAGIRNHVRKESAA